MGREGGQLVEKRSRTEIFVVGSVQQDLALGTEQGTTFDAVLEVTITGLATAARQAPSPQASALLDAHRL
jgi:hypothetical protein